MTSRAPRDGAGSSVRYVGFICNVMTGREGLTADRLAQIVLESGGSGPSSLRGTGNVVFDASPRSIAGVTSRIEHGIAEVIGRHELVFVRSIDHLRSAAAADPFAEAPIVDVHERCVTYLQASASELGTLPVYSRRNDNVIFAVEGLDVYSVTRLVNGRATSPGPALERLSSGRVTSRNWSTIEYILAKEPTLDLLLKSPKQTEAASIT